MSDESSKSQTPEELAAAILKETPPDYLGVPKDRLIRRLMRVHGHVTRLAALLAERAAAAEGEVELELVKGPEGTAVYLNSTRIAGPKPWGGGTITFHRAIRRADLATALKEAPHG